MRKGFALPVLIIFALFALVPALFVFFSLSFSTKPSTNVLSAKSSASLQLSVSSTRGTWDLFEYVCDTKADCITSANSGTLVEKLSGGQVEAHDVLISNSDVLPGKVLKLFVKPGWNSLARVFSAEVVPAGGSLSVETLDGFSVVLVTVPFDSSTKDVIVKFSD